MKSSLGRAKMWLSPLEGRQINKKKTIKVLIMGTTNTNIILETYTANLRINADAIMGTVDSRNK